MQFLPAELPVSGVHLKMHINLKCNKKNHLWLLSFGFVEIITDVVLPRNENWDTDNEQACEEISRTKGLISWRSSNAFTCATFRSVVALTCSLLQRLLHLKRFFLSHYQLLRSVLHWILSKIASEAILLYMLSLKRNYLKQKFHNLMLTHLCIVPTVL